MTFKPYPKYKASGVEWLGDMPSEWQLRPIKSITTWNDDVLDEKTDSLLEIQYVDISSVDFVDGIKSAEQMLFKDAPSRARRRVQHGDVILSTVRTYLRAIASIERPPENLIVSTGFAVLRPKQGLLPTFARYLFSASYVIENVIARSTGVSYPAINATDLVRIPVVIPNLSEQTNIATFLDRETAKIDTLIAKQEAMISLLKEKRQAVVSHAVMKGLDPSVPMKDSCVEWLGDVPEQWAIHSLKFVCDLIRDGTHLPPPRVDEGVPLLSVRNMVDGEFVLRDDDSMISEQDYALLCRSFTVNEGDVLLAIVGATLGKVALVRSMPRHHIQRSVAVLRANPETMNCRFLEYFLRSQSFQNQLWSGVGFSAQPGIYLGAITGFPCPVPELKSQEEIVEYLDSATTKIDALIAKAQQAIALQRERRTVLISAAVTGKIDVRSEVDDRKAA